MDRSTDDYIALLTASQQRLYVFIFALVPDRVVALDLLQETNLTLWHKAEEFEAGTNFEAWASRIARYHVLNYRRKLKRDKLVFDDELLNELAARQAMRMKDIDSHANALVRCLQELPQAQRDLLLQRYSPSASVKEIAKARGQTVGAVSQMLYRIRQSLLNCISRRLLEELA